MRPLLGQHQAALRALRAAQPPAQPSQSFVSSHLSSRTLLDWYSTTRPVPLWPGLLSIQPHLGISAPGTNDDPHPRRQVMILSPSEAEHAPPFKATGRLTASVSRSIEPVGPAFLAYARRKQHGRTFSEDEKIQAQAKVKNVEKESESEEDEPEDPDMLRRDPKEWKGQDHYAVLGLSKYRYKATDEQIKQAHRKKVLRHHPDKKASSGGLDDDSFFKCIQKAMDVLTDPTKRRQFDSVDEEADISTPSKKAKGSFFKLWGPVFASEARFSKKQPVLLLENDQSTKHEVERFYDFWYSFDSWRTFEYLDEEVPDDTDNRDNKRHVERKNKAQRQKKKTEDIARLRKLVDDALALDPRIKQFKQQEREAKEAKRLEATAGARKAAEDAKRKAEEEELKKKEEEVAAMERAADAKKGKESAKNAAKKDKRVVRGAVKDGNYFVVTGIAAPTAINKSLYGVEILMEKLESGELGQLANALKGKTEKVEIKQTFQTFASRLVERGSTNQGAMSCILE